MRFAVLLAFFPFLAVPAEAGASAGSLHVGVTIGGPAGGKPAARLRYTWGAAAISVTNAGFRRPQRLSSDGTVYWFSAAKNGADFRVAVSAATGRVVAVEPA